MVSSLEYIAFEHNATAAELVRKTYDTPPLAFVHSYGCQQNVNDGERIKGVLVDIGYGLCDKPEDADLILFNTCAVREHAEQRVFGNVGALKGLKEKKPGLMIGLCGCMANQKHVVEKLRQSYPYVDLVFGVDGIDTLPQLIAQKLQKPLLLFVPLRKVCCDAFCRKRLLILVHDLVKLLFEFVHHCNLAFLDFLFLTPGGAKPK